MQKPYVFLIDVDNTLLNNDLVKEEIRNSLIQILGEKEAMHFWHHHDEFRQYQKYVDFPKIIEGYCREKHADTNDSKLHAIFKEIDFRKAVYPHVEEVLTHLKSLGKVIIFTEGDPEYQKRKVEQAGLAAIADDVQIYMNKLDHFPELVNKYPSNQIVYIDDRVKYLLLMKEKFPSIFTVEICQGHYSTIDHEIHPAVDVTVDTIGDLRKLNTFLLT